MIINSKPSWDSTFMDIALVMAKRARCASRQVGAVIADMSNRIIATGFNGPSALIDSSTFDLTHANDPSRNIASQLGQQQRREERYAQPCTEWCPRQQMADLYEETNGREGIQRSNDYSTCPSIHAEMNALLFSDRSLRMGGTLYVTTPPCADCTKAISNSDLLRVVMLVDTSSQREKRASQQCARMLSEVHDSFEVDIRTHKDHFSSSFVTPHVSTNPATH